MAEPLTPEERAVILARLRNVNSCHLAEHRQDVARYEATVSKLMDELRLISIVCAPGLTHFALRSAVDRARELANRALAETEGERE